MKKFRLFFVLAVVTIALTTLTSCEKDDDINDLSEVIASQKIKWNLGLANQGDEEWPKYSIHLIIYSPVSIDQMDIQVELTRNLTWKDGETRKIHYLLSSKDFELKNVPFSWEMESDENYYVHYFSSKKILQNPVYEYGELVEEKNTFSISGYVTHNGVKYELEKEEYIPEP